MSLRHKLNNNPVVTTIGAVVLLALCGGLIVVQLAGGGRERDVVYFFDANSGKLFTAKASSRPIAAPSGPNDSGEPAGFRARIYACGACGDYDGMTLQQVRDQGATVAYLVRQPDRPEGSARAGGGAVFLSEPEPVRWVSGAGPAAGPITEVNLDCEDPGAQTMCEAGAGR